MNNRHKTLICLLYALQYGVIEFIRLGARSTIYRQID
jgi:hypothetical protein